MDNSSNGYRPRNGSSERARLLIDALEDELESLANDEGFRRRLGDAYYDDLLAPAAELVLNAAHHLTTHDVASDESLDYGLDRGESEGIRLANELGADLFVTDEFTTTNYLFVALALGARNSLYTTPHILCTSRLMNCCPGNTSTRHSGTTSRRKVGTSSTSPNYDGTFPASESALVVATAEPSNSYRSFNQR